eukprot:gene5142-7162_t
MNILPLALLIVVCLLSVSQNGAVSNSGISRKIHFLSYVNAHIEKYRHIKQSDILDDNVNLVANGNIKQESELMNTLKSLLPIVASAFCAAAIMYPLDLVRALQMANAGANLSTRELLVNFKNAHGYQGFFTQGLVPELARSTWMRFVKFALFPIVHLSLFGIGEGKGSAFSKAITAIVGSIPEALSIMPLEIAKIALQLDTANLYKNNMFRAMNKIYQDQGMKGFSVGYFGVQFRQAAWSAGYFASIKFFENKVDQFISDVSKVLKRDLIANIQHRKMISQLVSGFLAGMFGAAINTPFDTIRSTLQKKVLSNILSSSSTIPSITMLIVGKEIIAARGIGGLYAGFGFKAIHLGGGGALMAFFIPFFKNLILANQQTNSCPIPVTKISKK